MIHDSIAYLLRIGKVKINFINKKNKYGLVCEISN